VEWALVDDGFRILQARPITQSFPPLRFLSDANLSESYPDWTSPLSCDFVRTMYAHVFADSAKLLGATPRRRDELWPYYKSLIMEVDGHLYYNLQSYAVAMGALPKGETQFAKWLTLIGFSDKIDIPRPPVRKLGLLETCRIFIRLLYLGLNQNRLTLQFIDRCETRLKALKRRVPSPSDSVSAAECFNFLKRELENPSDLAMGIFNDFFLMSNKSQDLRNSTQLSLESVKPQMALAELAMNLPSALQEQLKAIQARADSVSSEELLQSLKAEFPEFHSALQKFLEDFGDRAFGDLKFENLNFHQDVRSLIDLLLRPQSGPSSLGSQAQTDGPFAPNRFQRALIYRESCRLIRTRYFAWFREMFLVLAKKQVREGLPWDVPQDIFFLRWDELVDWSQQRKSTPQLLETARARKAARHLDQTWPGTLIVAYGEESATLNRRREKSDQGKSTLLPDEMRQRLRGQVVSWPETLPLISGPLFRVKDPRSIPSDLDLKEVILWTDTTDPAWVYLLAQCQALISLKGNALSHVAIIARELGRPMIVKIQGDFDFFPSGTRVQITNDGSIQRAPNAASDQTEN